MTILTEYKSFGGVQTIYEHRSEACDCDMKVGVFKPDGVEDDTPALIWLSGMTCTEQNFITKAGAQRMAAKQGLVLITPDTSPRGDHVADDERPNVGQGAGFYLDATKMPWMKNFAMETYIRDELIFWMRQELPFINMGNIGISGHSMGGHGALTLHLKNPTIFKTCSAISPITAPSQTPWGQEAFKEYLGETPRLWTRYDATYLVAKQPSQAHILIDQGTSDNYIEQLKPRLFKEACQEAGQTLTLRMQEGYDHSYYFVASFIEDHIYWHAKQLGQSQQRPVHQDYTCLQVA